MSLSDSHYPGSSATATSISKTQLHKNNNHSTSHDARGYSNRYQNYIYVENPVDVYQRTFSTPPVP